MHRLGGQARVRISVRLTQFERKYPPLQKHKTKKTFLASDACDGALAYVFGANMMIDRDPPRAIIRLARLLRDSSNLLRAVQLSVAYACESPELLNIVAPSEVPSDSTLSRARFRSLKPCTLSV